EIFSDFGKRRFKIQKPSVIGWNGMFFIMITNLIMLRNKPICNFVNARLNHLLPNALNAWFDLPSMLTKTNFFNRFMKIFHNLLAKLDVLLDNITINDERDDNEELSNPEDSPMTFRALKSDPGRVGLQSVLQELNKLR